LYPTVSKVVREEADRFGLPYHWNPSAQKQIGSHYRFMRHLGRGTRQTA
jgi:hypothetical protein